MRNHSDGQWMVLDPSLRRRRSKPLQTINHLDPYRENFVATTAALIMGGLAAAGSIGGAAIKAHAAGSAAATQSEAAAQVRQQAIDAAKTATETVKAATQTANTGLEGGEAQGNQVIQNTVQLQMAKLQPYIDAGVLSLGEVQQLLGPNGTLASPGGQFSFTAKDYANSPEFAFEQQQANLALDRSAAAQGTLQGGGTVRASDRLNTGLASTYLDQAFNRSLATYNTNRQNLLTRIQGLTGITNLGFNATSTANQDIGNAGLFTNQNIQNTARQVAANNISSGMYSGQAGLEAARISEGATIGAANANSAAQLASGNAWGGAVTGLTNIAGQLYGLSQAPPAPTGNGQPIGTLDQTPATSTANQTGTWV